MSDVLLSHWSLPDPALRSLIRRCELVSALLRRQIEEEIVALVVPDLEPSAELWMAFRKQQNWKTPTMRALICGCNSVAGIVVIFVCMCSADGIATF